jgi:nicotinate-nucleotide adenylyltransferase
VAARGPLRLGHVPKRRIGLLGGSFNPAHDGHRHLSLEALKRLGLDEIWWLVAPQNPLKPVAGMAPLDDRLRQAQAVARHPYIRVIDVETPLGTRYTADTLAALGARFPHARFVWLMGADNLVQIPRWKEWQRIFRQLPIAVFARPTYCRRALAGKAAQRFARARIDGKERLLADRSPPAWCFVPMKLDPHSATAIRSPQALGPAGAHSRR